MFDPWKVPGKARIAFNSCRSCSGIPLVKEREAIEKNEALANTSNRIGPRVAGEISMNRRDCMSSLLDQTTRPSLENTILCFEVCDVRSSAELRPIAVRPRVLLLEQRNSESV